MTGLEFEMVMDRVENIENEDIKYQSLNFQYNHIKKLNKK